MIKHRQTPWNFKAMGLDGILARRRDPNDTLPSYNLEADPEAKRVFSIFQATQPLEPAPPVLRRVYHLQSQPYYDPSATGLPFHSNPPLIKMVPVKSEMQMMREQRSLMNQLKSAKPSSRAYYDPSAPLGLRVDPWDQNLRDTLQAYLERQSVHTVQPDQTPPRGDTLEMKASVP